MSSSQFSISIEVLKGVFLLNLLRKSSTHIGGVISYKSFFFICFLIFPIITEIMNCNSGCGVKKFLVLYQH